MSKFNVGSKVKIVKDAMGYTFPTPLDGYTVVAVKGDKCQVKRVHGIVSEFLDEGQFELDEGQAFIDLTKSCCLCGQSYDGFGHNAKPMKDGRCCDACNDTKVIPARIAMGGQ